MTIPITIDYSPKTQTSGVTLIGATVFVIDDTIGEGIDSFPDASVDAPGTATLCTSADFDSESPAEYETIEYTERDTVAMELKGVTRAKAGTAREWPAGSSIASYVPGYAFNAISTKLYDNAGAHNSIYRGKSLGTEYTQAQSDVIAAGTFDDLYIGDYWTIGGVVYRIAAFDYFYNVGDTNLTTHHAVIVPDTSFGNATMEATNITTNGYLGSLMRTTNIATAKAACKAAFTIGATDKVLNHRQLLCNASSSGLASGFAWDDCEVELMNEVMVYGSVAWGQGGGTSGYNVGSSHGRLPLFALRHDLMNTRGFYWLRDVVSATGFSIVTANGAVDRNSAANAVGVRPAFSIS